MAALHPSTTRALLTISATELHHFMGHYSRAYANWADPVNHAYGPDLMKRSVDLVQLFPMSGTKNGADIRLAIDVIDDLSRYQDVTHVVVVAGDSDYVALAQRCKRLGRRVIGVGSGKSVGRYWKLACDEFRYYGSLPGVPEPRGGSGGGSGRAAAGPAAGQPTSLLTRALRLVSEKSTTGRLAASALKVQMQRLDPAFTETGLGFKNFTEFLRSQEAIVDVEVGGSGTFVRWKSSSSSGRTINTTSEDPPREVVGGVPDGIRSMRQFLGVPISDGLGRDGEDALLSAVRAVWSLSASSAGTGCGKVDKDGVASLLGADGVPAPIARAAVDHVFHSGFPLLLKDRELHYWPNPELLGLDDGHLRGHLRRWTANRVRDRRHPETVDAEWISTVVYGAQGAPTGVRRLYSKVLDKPGYAQMVDALGALRLPPAVLWDVAEAVSEIPPDTPLGSLEEFTTAVRARSAERGRKLSDTRAEVAFRLLTAAGVLATLTHSPFESRSRELTPQAVARAAVTEWLTILIKQGLFNRRDFIHREGMYRLALRDRYRSDMRQWVDELIESVAEAEPGARGEGGDPTLVRT